MEEKEKEGKKFFFFLIKKKKNKENRAPVISCSVHELGQWGESTIEEQLNVAQLTKSEGERGKEDCMGLQLSQSFSLQEIVLQYTSMGSGSI